MRKNLKTILIDCDGVCLDWEEAFLIWMEHRGMVPILENHKEVYSINKWFGITPEEGKRYVEQFNASAAMGFLPPLRDAQHYIKMLAEKDQYKFVAVTSMSSDPYAQKLRIKNLRKLFGKDTFEAFHILECGADKDEILAELAVEYPGAYFIEDKPENANEGVKNGFKCLLVEHQHNMGYWGKATIVKNWEEIYSIITEMWRK